MGALRPSTRDLCLFQSAAKHQTIITKTVINRRILLSFIRHYYFACYFDTFDFVNFFYHVDLTALLLQSLKWSNDYLLPRVRRLN